MHILANRKTYKFMVSLLFGLVGAAVNFYPVNLIVPPFTASLVIGLVFPMLISVSWGWKYGLVTLFLGFGGQTMWFLWVPHNGWAPFVAIPVYNLWILWHGWCSDEKRKRPFRNFYAAEIPFRLFNTLIIYTLFNWSFRGNPTPWAPELIETHPSLPFLNFVAVKQLFEGVMILLLTDVLLNLDFFQRILLLEKRRKIKTGYIIRGSILFGLVLWLVSGFADFLFSESKRNFLLNSPRPSLAETVILHVPPYEIFTRILFLLICLAAGLVISRYVQKYYERSRELEQSEERYRTLVELMNDGIALIDREDRITYSNPSLQKMLGYGEDELRGSDFTSFLDGYGGEVLDTKGRRISDSRDGVFEIEWTTKGGRKILTLVTPRYLYDEKGDYNGFFAVLNDITLKREAENEKFRLENQLRQSQKMEAIGRLTGGIAHDFNNILTTIIGYSDLITNELPPDDPIQDKIDVIRTSGISAGNLTKQLLTFSRKQVIEKKPIDLNDLIANLLSMLERVSGEDITFEFHGNAALSMIMGDRTQIEQVIMNLVVNARDAMPRGGRLIIDTACVYLDEMFSRHNGKELAPGNYIVMSVSDTGTGIPLDIWEKIFDPFFTTKTKEKGTGLGLSTVYGIVRQHNGAITVFSEKDRGTCFRIYLPAVNDGVPYTLNEPKETIKDMKGSEKLLIVDDYPDIVKFVADLLSPMGYDLTTATDAGEALQIIRSGEKTFDLLLTDVVMPGMNGRELSREAKKLIPTIKIVFMSGYTADIISDEEAPGVHLINKPLISACVIRKIREVLDS